MTVNDELRVGRLFEFDDNFLKAILEINSRQSTNDITKRIHASQSTVCRHLEKLGKVCKFGKGKYGFLTILVK